MAVHRLVPFDIVKKENDERLTRNEIQKLAKEKGFFENEFSSYSVMVKDNGTPIVFGYTPLVSFALDKEEYMLKWVY